MQRVSLLCFADLHAERADLVVQQDFYSSQKIGQPLIFGTDNIGEEIFGIYLGNYETMTTRKGYFFDPVIFTRNWYTVVSMSVHGDIISGLNVDLLGCLAGCHILIPSRFQSLVKIKRRRHLQHRQ